MRDQRLQRRDHRSVLSDQPVPQQQRGRVVSCCPDEGLIVEFYWADPAESLGFDAQ